MNALINVVMAKIGEETVTAVNARDLHQFLEVGKDFTTWIKDRIAKYGFVETHDFEVFPETGENPFGGRPTQKYLISLDMAKELSMVERTAKGKQARQYFIECERRANSQPKFTLPDFTNPSIAARAWAEQHERADQVTAQAGLLIEKLNQLLDEYRPIGDGGNPVPGTIQPPRTKENHPTPLIELLETIAASRDERLNITKLCRQIAAKHGANVNSLRAIFYHHLGGIAVRRYFE